MFQHLDRNGTLIASGEVSGGAVFCVAINVKKTEDSKQETQFASVF